MLEQLININPALYNGLVDILNKEIHESEIKYNAPRGSYGARFFQPDDPCCDGLYNKWSYVYTSKTEEHLFAGASSYMVNPCNSYLYFGWYCDEDLGNNGYLKVMKNGIYISTIPARDVYNTNKPKYIYLDIQHITKFNEIDNFDFITYNDKEVDITCRVHPILYRISTKASLNIFNNERGCLPKIPMIESNNMTVAYNKLEQKAKYITELFDAISAPIEQVKVKRDNGKLTDELHIKQDPTFIKYLEKNNNKKYCKYCYSELKNSEEYCHYCGTVIDIKKKQTKERLHKELKMVKI